MYKSLAGVLGAVSALALTLPAWAATSVLVRPDIASQVVHTQQPGFDPAAVQDVQYYHHYYHHHWRHWHHWHRGPVVVIHPGY